MKGLRARNMLINNEQKLSASKWPRGYLTGPSSAIEFSFDGDDFSEGFIAFVVVTIVHAICARNRMKAANARLEEL